MTYNSWQLVETNKGFEVQQLDFSLLAGEQTLQLGCGGGVLKVRSLLRRPGILKHSGSPV